MNIKYVVTHEDVQIPKYANNGDAGMDLTAVEVEKSGNWFFPLYTYRTGIAVEIPKTHFIMLTPRSSLSKRLMWLANNIGIIDSGYRGELIFKFRSILGINPYKIGDRLGQMILLRKNVIELTQVESLSTSERGDGSFGSTGD